MCNTCCPDITRSQNDISKQNRKLSFLNHFNPTHVTFKQVDKHEEWRQAVQEDYDGLIKNQILEIEMRDLSNDVVDSIWLYKTKRKANRCTDHFKARLFAKGFTQRPGLLFS